jgi:hypothetical protein
MSVHSRAVGLPWGSRCIRTPDAQGLHVVRTRWTEESLRRGPIPGTAAPRVVSSPAIPSPQRTGSGAHGEDTPQRRCSGCTAMHHGAEALGQSPSSVRVRFCQRRHTLPAGGPRMRQASRFESGRATSAAAVSEGRSGWGHAAQTAPKVTLLVTAKTYEKVVLPMTFEGAKSQGRSPVQPIRMALEIGRYCMNQQRPNFHYADG